MATRERQRNFIMSLDLQNLVIQNDPGPNKPVEHFVYASSLYGTTFGVFCKILGDKKGEDSFHVNALQLRIINYAGVINIGFMTGDVKPHNAYDPEKKSVYFAVQGANLYTELKIDTKELVIAKDAPVTLTFNRILYPLTDFIAINDNVKDRTKQSSDPVPPTTLFDTEFNYRNGVDLYYNLLRPGMRGFVEPEETALQNLLPSPRCHQSFVRLIFP